MTSRRLAAPLAMILVLVALDALLRSRGDFDYRLVRGFRRIDLKTWRRSAGIHSPLVVLWAAMPGIGTFAYLLSWPMLSRFSLVRVAADAVEEHRPFDIYRRLGMKRIVARPVRYQPRPQDAAGTPGGGE